MVEFDAVRDLNRLRLSETGDPEIETRINAYETAFRMQTAAPQAMDVRSAALRMLQARCMRA